LNNFLTLKSLKYKKNAKCFKFKKISKSKRNYKYYFVSIILKS